MTWIVEDGKEFTDGLPPYYKPADLETGMKVQILDRRRRRKLQQAVITRSHSIDTHAQQGTVYRERCSSDDGEEITESCELFRPVCVHVRYRNGVRAIADCLAFVRPPNSAILQLAELAEDDS